MQRPLDSLHRATPVPTLDLPVPRKVSTAVSIESILEDADEVESKNLPVEKMDQRGWLSKVRKYSPSQADRLSPRQSNAGGQSESLASRDLQSQKGSLRRPFSLSAQTSPSGSVDSQGSGTTARSLDSLHRPTPIPTDASSSLVMIPSSGKRANGRLQSSTPTINEFEDLREGLDDDLGLGSLGRNESLGTRSSGSLHRATPVPMDLSSSSSSGPKFTNHRLSTPTIKEDETDRDSRLDSSEYYYGRSQRSLEQQSPGYESSGKPTLQNFMRNENQTRLPSHPFADSAVQKQDIIPPAEKEVSALASNPQTSPLAEVSIGQPAVEPVACPPQNSSTYSQGHSPSPFTPFVDSKDWERDILGVARFLRMCPGLSRQLIGDLLGENNERCLRVLECFTASFDFTGLSFEAALREYLESFRMPGESQKIYRILESWSRQFFRQCPGIFRDADAVLILAFSLILLNTDKHNRTVKQKMTCTQFLKSTRGINGGQDFPKDFLEELYRNIERRAIRIPPAQQAESFLQRTSLPEPIRATKERYESPKKARQTKFLCF